MGITDILKTVAVLDSSGYIREANRIAGATQSAFGAPNISWMDRIPGIFAAVGAALTGATVSMAKQAIAMQTWTTGLDAVLGSAKAGADYFDKITNLAEKSPFGLDTQIRDAHMLLGAHMEVNETLRVQKDLADAVATTRGPDDSSLFRANYAISEMASGPLSLRQVRQLTNAGVSNAYSSVEKYLGLSGKQMQNLGKLQIPGEYGVQAVMHGIEEDPKYAGGAEKRMDNVGGQIKRLDVEWGLFSKHVMDPILPGVTHGLKELNDLLDGMSHRPISQAQSAAIVGAGPALLITGAVIAGWRKLAQAKTAAKIAAIAEKGAEQGKIPVLGQESQLVEETAGKWSKMAGWLQRVGVWALGARGATASLTATTMAGVGVMSLYALAIAGVVAIGYELQDVWYHVGAAIDDVNNKTDEAAKKAAALGYDIKPNKAQGYAGMSFWQRQWQNLKEAFGAPTVASGYNAAVGPDFFKKHHKMPPHGIRAQQEQHAKELAQARSGNWRPPGFDLSKYSNNGKSKNWSENDPSFLHDEFDIDKYDTLRKIAESQHRRTHSMTSLREIGTNGTKEIAAINHEMATLNAHLAKTNSGTKEWLDTEKKILALTEKSEEVKTAVSQAKQDAAVSRIISASNGGPSLNDMGLSKMHIYQLSQGKVKEQSLSSQIAKARNEKVTAQATRPIVVNLSLDGKIIGTMSKTVMDDALRVLIEELHGAARN